MSTVLEKPALIPTGDQRVSIYQPEQSGLIFPVLATFTDTGQERQHRKERLVAACRAFALHGFDYGFAGHLTVRDPENPGLYWTNPMAVHFSQVKVSNLILADHSGRVVEGRHAINRAGFVLHSAVHEQHPDIVAMCHAHTVYGVAFASLGKKLEPITQDAAVFFEDHVVIGDDAGQVSVEVEAGNRIANSFRGVKAAIHQNHGLFTVGQTVDEAAFWFLSMDRSCHAQLLAMAAGTPKLIDHDSADYTQKQTGHPLAGWLSFQPLWQEICRTDPDLFD